MRKNNYKTKTQLKRAKGLNWTDTEGLKRTPQGEYIQVYRETYGDYPQSWVIHHINRDRLDNTPSNLIALPTKMRGTLLQLPKSHQLSRDLLSYWVDRYLKDNKRLDKKYVKKQLKKIQKDKTLIQAKKDLDLRLARKSYLKSNPLGYIKPKIELANIDQVKVKRYSSKGKLID